MPVYNELLLCFSGATAAAAKGTEEEPDGSPEPLGQPPDFQTTGLVEVVNTLARLRLPPSAKALAPTMSALIDSDSCEDALELWRLSSESATLLAAGATPSARMGSLAGWESDACAPVTVPVLCGLLMHCLTRLDMHETGARAIGSADGREALEALKVGLQSALPPDHCGRHRDWPRPRRRGW